MSQPETERDQLIAETVKMQQAKLAQTRMIQANTRRDTSGETPKSSDWKPIGSVMERLKPGWDALLERVRVEREERIATFTATGGACIQCFDQGICDYCERGQQERLADWERRRLVWIADTGLPDRFRGGTFASFPGRPELARQVQAYLGEWQGKRNLILMGRFGVGKTGLVGAAINEMSGAFRQRDWRVVFITTPRLFDQLRAGFDDGSFTKLMRRCQNANLLILDDLGAEKPTEWVQERLYAIVNHRYEHELPIWVTTNLTPDGLAAAIGERTWWRLQEGACLLVATGPNLREGKP